jgi:hypothetical protein
MDYDSSAIELKSIEMAARYRLPNSIPSNTVGRLQSHGSSRRLY